MRHRSLKVITRPKIEPVTLTEAKAQVGLDVEQTDWDQFLVAKIAAGRVFLESRLQTTFIATQYRATWESITCRVVKLPRPPLLVDDDHGLTITVDGEELAQDDLVEIETDSRPGWIELPSSASGKLVVSYWAGVLTLDEVDPLHRSLLLKYVDHEFRNRGILADGTAVELPQAFEAALAAASWSGSY